MQPFAQGAGLLASAARFLLKQPRLWLLVLIPLAINALLLAALMTWGFSALGDGLREWMRGLTAWYWTALVVIIKVFFWVVILAVVYFIFTPLALLIGSPFNDYLAERTERAHGFGLPEEKFSPNRLAIDLLLILRSELRRLLFFGSVFIALLALHLIPVIGSALYPVAAFYWASRCFAYEFISYAADRRRMSFKQKWNLMRRHRALTLGFGMTAAALFLIPFVNVLVVPLCAVGGTLLFKAMTHETSPSAAGPGVGQSPTVPPQ